MDFSFTSEQDMLRDSVRRLIGDSYSLDKRRAYAAMPKGFSSENWRRYAELGLLAIPFAEEDGGVGGGGVETMVVMETFGRGLVVEPYLSTVVLGGGLVRLGASEAVRRLLIPDLIAGDLLLAFAHGEPQARYTLSEVATTARKDGGGYVLSGRKSVVLNGDSADRFVVSARTAGSSGDREGITLFLVDRTAGGVDVRGYATNDGARAAEIALDNVAVSADRIIGVPDGALPLIERAVDQAIAALCAEAVGIMGALYELTTDYLKTRQQFGAPIGTFQALQHRLVDMLIACEQARSMACLAAMTWDEVDATRRARVMAAAKTTIGRSGRFVGQQSIQLHGGIGMTNEYIAGHYFKRLTMIDVQFGNADHHLTRFAEQLPGAE
jgi:pimeloyl-CoA dehydrogenase small subunit